MGISCLESDHVGIIMRVRKNNSGRKHMCGRQQRSPISAYTSCGRNPQPRFLASPVPASTFPPPPRTAYRHLRDATFDLVLWRPCLPLPPHTTCETQPSTLFSGV